MYAIGREGIAKRNLSDESKDLTPLLDVVLEQVPLASGKEAEPFQAQVFNLGYDTFMGRLAICRIYQGSVSVNQNVLVKNTNGTSRSARLTKIFSFDGITKKEVSTATAGDIVLVAGIADVYIGETLCVDDSVPILPAIGIDEPTISLQFLVNDSPFAGEQP